MKRARSGFTLIETLVAMLATSFVVLALFGGLTFVGRGYRRDELAMARSQAAQLVFDALAADLEELYGTALPKTGQLNDSGYEGSAATFVAEPRRGAHQVFAFGQNDAKASEVLLLSYDERAGPSADGWQVAMLGSHFVKSANIKPAPPPWGVTKAAFVVPLPPQDPDVVYLALSTKHEGRFRSVLWSFFRRKKKHFEAGSILRADEQGTKNLAAHAPLVAEVDLVSEWVYVNLRTGAQLEPLELMLHVTLRESGDLTLPFAEPPFRTRRVFTAGL